MLYNRYPQDLVKFLRKKTGMRQRLKLITIPSAETKVTTLHMDHMEINTRFKALNTLKSVNIILVDMEF